MYPDLFASTAALRKTFEQRLVELLGQDDLGVFILVLANASFEQSSFDRLQRPLQAAFLRWSSRFDRDDKQALSAPANDVAVFERLRQVGFDRLQATRWRRLGPWELQFNQLRALRPARMSGAVVTRLDRPFDPAGFHFNRGFLRREILWEGEMAGAAVRLLYNKFPFAELHGLMVPFPEDCRAQLLTPGDHVLVWEIAQQLGHRLPGLGFGYNAQGAYASVNHLHFQMFVRSQGQYPIESARWQHNAGTVPYPLPVRRYTDRRSAWLAVRQMHEQGQTYNLLYRPGAMYLVGRAMQGSYVHSGWTGGFAWSELAGAITMFDPADFERLSEADLDAEFQRLALRP